MTNELPQEIESILPFANSSILQKTIKPTIPVLCTRAAGIGAPLQFAFVHEATHLQYLDNLCLDSGNGVVYFVGPVVLVRFNLILCQRNASRDPFCVDN